MIGAVTVISVFCTSAQPGKFTLNGELKEYSGKLFFSYGSIPDGVLTIDSTVVKDGKFTFTGEIGQPLQAALSGDSGFDQNTSITLFIEPAVMNFSGSMDDRSQYTLTGSPLDAEVRARAELAEPYIPELMTLRGGGSAMTEEEKAARMKRVQEFVAMFKQ